MSLDASSNSLRTQSGTLQVLVVDDTITYRSILSKILANIPEVTNTVTASNGKIALDKLEATRFDLVLLDIEMPEMDGLECLTHIKKRFPDTTVVMVSGMNRSSADVTIQALQSGALDFIPKPDGSSIDDNTRELQAKLTQVMKTFIIKRNLKSTTRLTSSTVSPTSASSSAPTLTPLSTNKQAAGTSPLFSKPAPQPIQVAPLPTRFDVLTIGVSTGGPNALNELIPALPADLNVPIFLVQHMPPFFTASLAQSLQKRSQLSVKEAEDQEEAKPNTVYIAPGGRHMAIKRHADGRIFIELNDDPPENSCRPAVDVLFRSVAKVYGKNILSLIMTGMGNDGAKGVKVLKEHGCYSLTQSESSCVVYGMPRAVDEIHLSDESLDLATIAGRVTELIKKGRK